MKFERFKPVKDFDYSSGWDKFALDYIHLPGQNPIYALTKQLMYKIIEKNIHLREEAVILDIGCGSGNDFPYFLSKKAKIYAFDMSAGMLNKAGAYYHDHIQTGRITLFKGHLEELSLQSFEDQKFDLIFSVTGGLSYINNNLLYKVFKVLKLMLKPHGLIISGHFSPFCLGEFLYYLLRLQLKSAGQRDISHTQVRIKEETMTMYFRSEKDLTNIIKDLFTTIKFYPLLAVTPPYQTGYLPGTGILNLHKKLEQLLLDFPLLTRIADQTVMVIKDE